MTMASSNMLPYDDLELEMEEVEGLVEVSSVGRGKTASKASKAGSAVVGAVAGVCSSKYRSRWGCCTFVVLIVVILTLWLTNTKDIEAAEGTGGSHVSDVDAKNVTQVEPTPAPTMKEKTPEPTPKATPSPTKAPTAQPTAKATSPPTAQPTAKATSSPTANPTKAEATTDENKLTPTEQEEENTEADKGDTKEVPDDVPDEIPDAKDEQESPKADTAAPLDATDKTSSAEHTAFEYSFPSTPFAVRTENPPTTAVLDDYAKTWGTWQLGDLPEMDRSAFCGDYAHCDVPKDKLPNGAWQADSAYVTKFLEEADKLVDRARNAILAEYGKSANDTEMFDLTYRDDLNRRELGGKGPPDNGGWTTKRSMDGLARRLLHAIMTRDTFTFVMGGHSAAAGHG